MKKSNLVCVITLLILATYLTETIMACSCEVPTVCQAYTRANTVFIGKLIKIEKDKKSSLGTVNAYFEVEKTYKGNTDKIEIVKFLTGSCERAFLIDEKYFVYNDHPDSFNDVCNRTDTLLNSVSELDYVNNLSTTDPIYTIGGRVDAPTKYDLKEIKLVIEQGQNRYDVPFDKNGFYTFKTKKRTDMKVIILLPFEAAIQTKVLGDTFLSTGKTIEYSLRFKSNECEFREISIEKK